VPTSSTFTFTSRWVWVRTFVSAMAYSLGVWRG